MNETSASNPPFANVTRNPALFLSDSERIVTSGDLATYNPPAGKLHYPANSVVGVVGANQALALLAALTAAGSTDDKMHVILPARRDDFDVPVTGGGVRGAAKRVVADLGGTLDLVKALRDGLQPGRSLVQVRVSRDAEARARTAATFWRFGGTQVHYLTHFSIERMQRTAAPAVGYAGAATANDQARRNG